MPDIEGVPYEAAGTALDVATAQALATRHREVISAGVTAGTEAKALAQSVVAEVGTIRTAVVQSANSASAAAGSAAQAQQTATALVPRVEHIETIAGLAPGEVTDAQTANLIAQPSTATRDALSAAFVSSGEEWVNAKKLAEVNGLDITTAIEQALSASRNVTLPPGSYTITRPIVLSSNHRLIGGGGKNATKIVVPSDWDTATYPAVVRMSGYAPRMESVVVDARATTGPDAVRIEADYEPAISNCQILGGAHGINLLSGLEARFEYVSINGCAGSGVYVQNVADSFFLNVSTDNCQFGLRAVGGSISAVHFHAIKSKEHGFYLVGPGSSQFYGCHADTNGKNGYHVTNANNTRFTDCWSFRNGASLSGTSYNWLISNATESSLVGCSSNNEANVAAAFSLSGTNNGLSMVACTATTKGVTGSLAGVNVVACTGKLAPLNTGANSARQSIAVAAGSTGTIALDLGYTPDMTYNAKAYRLDFTNRGSSDNALTFGYQYLLEASGTSGAVAPARTFLIGDASKSGGNFTATLSRSGSVATVTITNNSSETVVYGLELSTQQAPKV